MDRPFDAPPTSDAVVVTEGLVKSFGDDIVLDHIDLVVPRGAVVGLIGPSGCGKTTLVRQLVGLSAPTEGTVRVFDEDPVEFSLRARSRIGYMPQQPVLFPTLSVWGNLSFVASVYGIGLRHRRQRLRRVLDLVDLGGDRRKQLAQCSGGMQRRLSLAATLVHDPDLLFLDEPTAGVDPLLRARFWDHFRELCGRGTTIVVPTQYVGEAAMCDLVAVVSDGRLLAVVPPTGLRSFADGGDVLVYSLGEDLRRADLVGLGDVDGVREVRRTNTGVELVVADAERDAPAVEAALAGLGTTPTREEYDPTYDDLFVRIIERDRAERDRAERQLVDA